MVIAKETKTVKINEKLVAEVWKRQILAKPLRTTDGQRLEVVYCGRHCCDRGPDFRGAMIAFDGQLRRGDVEIHVHDADWQGHRHHLDPAYDDVILHVVIQQRNDSPPRKSNGEAIPVLSIEPHLTVDVGALPSLLASTPYTPFRCTKLTDAHEILPLLDVAGQQRLRAKAASLEGDLAVLDAEQVLYRAIMMALGYTRNTAAFAQLADIAPFSLLRAIALNESIEDRPLALQAFLTGKAGLLSSQRHRRSLPDSVAGNVVGGRSRTPCWPPSSCEMQLEDKWTELSIWDDGSRVGLPWHFGRVRPDNHPTRRILAGAKLFAALIEEGLCHVFVELLGGDEPEAACSVMERTLMVKGFIGKARAAEIVTNAILPFMMAYGQTTSASPLSHRAAAAFRSYRFPAENEISRYMSELIFGASSLSPLQTACRHQGLLHLYKMWCVDKSCADCPLSRIGIS